METPQLVDKNSSCLGCGPQKVAKIWAEFIYMRVVYVFDLRFLE